MKNLILFALASGLLLAQSQPAGSGHWEGTIQTPDGNELQVAIDLAPGEKGEWAGDIDVPPQNIKDLPLTAIKVADNKVSFGITVVPGNPAAEGQISADGKTIAATLTQGGAQMPLKLKWISEAKVAVQVKSGKIGPEFEGVWDGVLETPDGNKLRLRIKLANGPDGSTGTFNSLDQNNTDMPLSAIAQTGEKIKFELKIAGGAYEGTLNKEAGEIAGAWNQGMFNAPLNLKKQK